MPDANAVGTFADRRPGAMFRAMAELYLREHPKQSRESLARKLQRRLTGDGVAYHHRTVKRQLSGAVSSVPQVVEDAMRTLLERAAEAEQDGSVAERLAAAGLRVAQEERRRPHVAVARLVPPTRLWLYLNPGHSKRYLARKLGAALAARGVRISADRLQSNLAGKGSYVRREVLLELIGMLAREGIGSEADVLHYHDRLALQIERALQGRRLTEAERLVKLADTWWLLGRRGSKRALAKRLKERLAERGIEVSLDHLQDQLHGRKEVVQKRVVDELEALVVEALPAGMELADAVGRMGEDPQAAEDLAWVDAQPIAALAQEWLAANPGASRRQLALGVTRTVNDMGYQTSEHTVQPILAGLRQKTRGYIYRATLLQFEDRREVNIPQQHIVSPLPALGSAPASP